MAVYTAKADMAHCFQILPFHSPEEVPVSYTIDGINYHGIPKFFRPTVNREQIDASIVRYTVIGQHASGLTITVQALRYLDFPVTEWIAYFENHADRPSPIVSDICIHTAITGASPTLLYTNTADPVSAFETQQASLAACTEGFRLSAADRIAPYSRLQFEDRGVNLAIGYPANWHAIYTHESDVTDVRIGQAHCHMRILPGETIRSPRLTMLAYDGDSSSGCNLWRRWYLTHVIPRVDGVPLSQKICFYPSNTEDPDSTYTRIAAFCEKHEMARCSAVTSQENQPIDLSDPITRERMTAHTDHMIKELDITVYECNSCLDTLPPADDEKEDRIGVKENLFAQGFLLYLDMLLERNPGLWIKLDTDEMCRFDLDTVKRVIPHLSESLVTSFQARENQRRFMLEWFPCFYDTLFGISHQKNDSDSAVTVLSIDKFSIHAAIAPILSIPAVPCMQESMPDDLHIMLSIWRRACPLLLDSDFYWLQNTQMPDSGWFAIQLDNPSRNEGLIQLIRGTDSEEETFPLYMTVRSPDALYFFEDMETGDMMQLTGEQLQFGIPLSLQKKQGIIWFYHTVDFD